MKELAPSLLSANFANLQEDIKTLEENGINYLHLDIMDGNFVPNISFGPGIIKSIRKISNMTFDVHLMIENCDMFIEDFVDAGADIITVHAEATKHLHRSIQNIKSHGVKAGVALNPSTSLDTLDYLLEDIDLVLIMSVNPGFGGQSFIESMKDKLKELARIKKEKNLDFIIAIDGGVKTSNVAEIAELGAELIVSGSDVFGADSIGERIEEYKTILQKYE